MTSAEVLLVESVGAFYFGAGTPRVICRFEAVPPFRQPRDQDRRISCIVWEGAASRRDTHVSGSWHEYSPSLTLAGSQEFVEHLTAVVLPPADRLKGIVDTSAVLRHVFLRVRREHEMSTYDINMYSNGFDGEGAETVKALCRALFRLAGFDGYDETIYGSEAPNVLGAV